MESTISRCKPFDRNGTWKQRFECHESQTLRWQPTWNVVACCNRTKAKSVGPGQPVWFWRWFKQCFVPSADLGFFLQTTVSSGNGWLRRVEFLEIISICYLVFRRTFHNGFFLNWFNLIENRISSFWDILSSKLQANLVTLGKNYFHQLEYMPDNFQYLRENR